MTHYEHIHTTVTRAGLTRKSEEDKERENPIDTHTVRENCQTFIQGGWRILSKSYCGNVGDVRVDKIPALIWCFATVHVFHHDKCIGRDCDEHLVADECHETKVELWVERGVHGGRLGHCAREDLVMSAQILESEYCANCQSGKDYRLDGFRTGVHQRDTADYDWPGIIKQVPHKCVGNCRVAAKAFKNNKSVVLIDVIYIFVKSCTC